MIKKSREGGIKLTKKKFSQVQESLRGEKGVIEEKQLLLLSAGWPLKMIQETFSLSQKVARNSKKYQEKLGIYEVPEHKSPLTRISDYVSNNIIFFSKTPATFPVFYSLFLCLMFVFQVKKGNNKYYCSFHFPPFWVKKHHFWSDVGPVKSCNALIMTT